MDDYLNVNDDKGPNAEGQLQDYQCKGKMQGADNLTFALLCLNEKSFPSDYNYSRFKITITIFPSKIEHSVLNFLVSNLISQSWINISVNECLKLL